MSAAESADVVDGQGGAITAAAVSDDSSFETVLLLF